jgi:His/Glu/Gln/Arg/opine family amino acid ABC transporter permease subunit
MMRYLADWLPQMAYAAGQTAKMMLVAFAVALVFGAVLVLMRRSRIRIVSGIARAYITVMRGTPVLAQLFFIYFGLAEMGLVLSSWQAAIIGLGGNSAAYVAEIYRAGFESVSHGQIEAARSLGLRRFQITRLVVLPQMVTVVLPPLANQSVVLIKETSVASLIAAPELMHVARDLAAEFYMPLELYLLSGLMYLLLAFPLSVLARQLETRLRVQR